LSTGAALYGLLQLDTKEARRLLFEAESWEQATPEDTQFFRQELRIAKRAPG
jgi:hypothetical protein